MHPQTPQLLPPPPLPTQSPPAVHPELNLWRRLQRWLGLRPPSSHALVARVIDGDSIRLADGREVRYLGIDAPETHGAGGQPDPWAEAAKAANLRLVEGKRVRLEAEAGEPDEDIYGRLLRHVFVSRTWVNGRLVEMGLARVSRSGATTQRRRKLLRMQEEAKARGRGIWTGERPWWRFW